MAPQVESNKPIFRVLPADDYDAYLCRLTSFMQNQNNTLRELGVSNAHIYTEAFDPALLVRDDETDSGTIDQLPVAKQ